MTPPQSVVRATVTGPTGAVGVHVWNAADLPTPRPVLLALHGWTDGGAVYGPLAADLAADSAPGWPVVAVDAPAHGWTPWTPAQEYRLPDAVPGLCAVIDALAELTGSTGPVVLLGHSMGGLTAAHAASLRPGRVAHLVLEDPVKITNRPSRTLSRWRTTRDASRWLAWMTNMATMTHAERLVWVANRNSSWDPREFEPWSVTKSEIDLDHLHVPVDWGPPLVELLTGVQAPVTLVLGRFLKGGVTSPREIRACIQASRQGCEVVRLNAGHHPRREASAAFAALVAGLLRRYDPR